MEYFIKRVLPVAVVGVLGGGYYGIHRFMKYMDHQASGRNIIPIIDQKNHSPSPSPSSHLYEKESKHCLR